MKLLNNFALSFAVGFSTHIEKCNLDNFLTRQYFCTDYFMFNLSDHENNLSSLPNSTNIEKYKNMHGITSGSLLYLLNMLKGHLLQQELMSGSLLEEIW